MKIDGIRFGLAERDDECAQCAYPFDTTDRVLVDDRRGAVFCSSGCVHKWRDANACGECGWMAAHAPLCASA